ncbi:ABC superfamily ATP binding cassette transporter, ABC protein [Enterococcus casseliflavus]|uniref:ABC transporter ATP-binding protein n=1 Tax=Enterococcus casseliflavus TaxID=37734 RepID=UPI000DFB1FCE|nr:ATP-binding cassette domain-containing protein [Enterococcus casseliflavus]GEB30298.1 daunorubicin ABC transporter ATP-binding protein [Enterococcus casseliflavus]STP33418.1 ABC superfamily ATP binding cassette transporter, ABC protein [Enterococcus casseliflavus]
MEKAVNLNNINMEYTLKKGTLKALSDINISINKGEVVGVIGSNGAGKSTLIKVLTGVLKPTSGQVEINGIIPWKSDKEFKKSIGIVFGQRSQLWWELPVIDSFKVHELLYGKDSKYTLEFLNDIEEVVPIKALLNKPARQLSLGQRMLCDIILSMYHNPKILFLDEPTIGLDAYIKSSIRQMIRTINEKYQTTILITSHDLIDIQETCSKVILLNKGQTIYDGRLDTFQKKYNDEVEITLKSPVHHSMGDVVRKNGFSYRTTISGEIVLFGKRDGHSLKEVLSYIIQNVPFEDITVTSISIEEMAKKIYKDSNYE